MWIAILFILVLFTWFVHLGLEGFILHLGIWLVWVSCAGLALVQPVVGIPVGILAVIVTWPWYKRHMAIVEKRTEPDPSKWVINKPPGQKPVIKPTEAEFRGAYEAACEHIRKSGDAPDDRPLPYTGHEVIAVSPTKLSVTVTYMVQGYPVPIVCSVEKNGKSWSVLQ